MVGTVDIDFEMCFFKFETVLIVSGICIRIFWQGNGDSNDNLILIFGRPPDLPARSTTLVECRMTVQDVQDINLNISISTFRRR